MSGDDRNGGDYGSNRYKKDQERKSAQTADARAGASHPG